MGAGCRGSRGAGNLAGRPARGSPGAVGCARGRGGGGCPGARPGRGWSQLLTAGPRPPPRTRRGRGWGTLLRPGHAGCGAGCCWNPQRLGLVATPARLAATASAGVVRLARAASPIPPRSSGMGRAGGGGRAVRASGEDGSRATSQRATQLPAGSRSRRTSRCGRPGSGKRADSWKVRGRLFASSVVTHSEKSVAKPREYSNASSVAPRTSKCQPPRPLSSTGRDGLPANGSGSRTCASRVKSCRLPSPAWNQSTRSVAGAAAQSAASSSAGGLTRARPLRPRTPWRAACPSPSGPRPRRGCSLRA